MSDPHKIAITNVRVFHGSHLSATTTVAIEGGVIVSDAADAIEVDGENGVLLPGLIDAHVHCTKHDELRQMAKAGVTTALDMGFWPLSVVNCLRRQPGVTDFFSAGIGMTAPGSMHTRLRSLPQEALVVGRSEAIDFVTQRVAEGSDYIKVIADIPGPSQETLNAATEEAKKQGKLVIAHAAGYEPVRMAQEAKVDFLTHVPIDKPITQKDVQIMLEEDRSCIPTLAMMEAVAALNIPGNDYAHCQASVNIMHTAGVAILAGSDANDIPDTPAPVKHGSAIHRELQLLVKAGLSPANALQSATSLPAKHFGLNDRGVIEPGRRADLVLIAGDPLTDIQATSTVQRVWCGGIEVV